MNIVNLNESTAFSPEKMQKNSLFETDRLFCDLYCLEPGQAQKTHAHPDSDKIYIVLEGTLTAVIGDEEAELTAGQAVLAEPGVPHGLANRSAERAKALVFMTPKPGR